MFYSNLRGRIGCYAGAAALSMAVLSGCGGGSDGAPAQPAKPVNAAPVTALLLSGMVEAGGSGADVSASAGSELILSASGSADPDGDTVTYQWSIVSKPAASALVLSNDTAVKQTIKPDVGGDYVIKVRVTDSKGAFSEKQVAVLIRDNTAPVTNIVVTASYAGPITTKATQYLNVGSSVVLDARGSTDADGDLVTTTWTLTDKPAGSLAGLTVDGAVTHFVADVAGVFKIRAHGIDARGAFSDTIYVFDANNSAPQTVIVATASAPGAVGGNSIAAPAGYIVSLSAAGSYDPNTYSAMSFAWTVTSKPAGSTATLSSATGVNSQIATDMLGEYVVTLTATNAAGAASSYRTTIVVANRSPIAYISTNAAPVAVQTGPSVRLPLNTTLTLRGAGSVDADGDALAYSWSVSSKPSGSAAVVSAASGATVQVTADLAGAYVVLLRVTDAGGAFSERAFTFVAGSFAPVAVIDKHFATVLLGGTATASAALSFDDDSGALTYVWAIDAAPAGSSATIAAPSASALTFTPDVAGNYVASVTVSDGLNSNVAYVTIRALATIEANVALTFVPLETRYSTGLDKLVILATNPNALKIVDPFTAQVRTVVLPISAKSFSLSPDGKLAAVLHEGIVSLVDVDAGTLLHSTSSITSHSEALVNNAGIVYLFGRSTYQSSDNGVTVIDGRTGTDLTATLGLVNGSYYDNYRGVYSSLRSRAFMVNVGSPGTVYALNFDTAGKVGPGTNSPYNGSAGNQLFLSENQDLLFTSSGSYFRTDTLLLAGKLAFSGTMQSLSHSSQADETLVMLSGQGNWPDYSRTYQASYKRYVGALFLPDTDLALPLVNGLQSYGINIYHSSTGKQVALVQTATDSQFGAGAKYYVLAR